MPAPALSLQQLGKTFPGQIALADITFDVLAGEVHALVGENGCGKSTLIKCLAGYHHSDPGSVIAVGGETLPMPHTPQQARESGLAFVHQDLGLIPTASVLENLAIGRGFAVGRGWRIRWKAERREAQALLDELEVHVRPAALISELSQADKTLVAIVRGLRDAGETGRLLVLDEPTAALPEAEVNRLFEFVRTLRARGLGILYVSHRLKEVFALCQSITVLRDARYVGTFPAADLDERTLITHIIGKSLDDYISRPPETRQSETLLKADALSGLRVRNVSFEIKRGEIVGVAGLLGSGRSELGRLISGAQAPVNGSLILSGRAVSWKRPKDAIRAGVVRIPEDRRREGGVLTMSVGANLTLPDMRKFFRMGRLQQTEERRVTASLANEYDIRPRDTRRPFFQLSGGNQQKIVVAKWMRLAPKLVVFDEPVQGVDVGSKAQIYGLVQQAAIDGSGVLLIDSDFEDLARICSKVLIIHRGELVGSLDRSELSRERIVQLIYMGEEAAA